MVGLIVDKVDDIGMIRIDHHTRLKMMNCVPAETLDIASEKLSLVLGFLLAKYIEEYELYIRNLIK